MKPSKPKRHLETSHSEHTIKDMEFFRRHEESCKRQRLDRTGSFQQENTALVQASCEVTLEIAQQKKTSHNRRKAHHILHVKDGEINSWRFQCSKDATNISV